MPMSAETILAIIAVVTLLFSVGVLIFNGGWGLSGRLTKMESRLAQTIAETARDLEDRQDASARMMGETVKAMREQMAINDKEAMAGMHQLSDKIRSVEIWARDEFVRKESFREVCSRIENTVTEQSRTVNSAVQSVRDAIIALATGRKIEQRKETT